MDTKTIVICVVALLLGMLIANMLKDVCGCKNVVEGQGCFTNLGVTQEQSECQPYSTASDYSLTLATNQKKTNTEWNKIRKNTACYTCLKGKDPENTCTDSDYINYCGAKQTPPDHRCSDFTEGYGPLGQPMMSCEDPDPYNIYVASGKTDNPILTWNSVTNSYNTSFQANCCTRKCQSGSYSTTGFEPCHNCSGADINTPGVADVCPCEKGSWSQSGKKTKANTTAVTGQNIYKNGCVDCNKWEPPGGASSDTYLPRGSCGTAAKQDHTLHWTQDGYVDSDVLLAVPRSGTV